MAHNNLNPKSSNVSNTYNVADAEPITVVSYLASEGIAVGDLVTLNPTSGTLTYALPPDRLTQGSTLRPLYAPLESYGGQMAPVTARAPSGATAVSYGLNAQTLHSITLKSGNILHAWVSESAAVLMITGLDNGFYFEPTAISGGGVIYPCVLAGGGFAVVTVVGGQSKIYVYSDAGVQTATATMSGTPLAICALTGGNFVVETTIAGTGSISIGIFNPACGVVLPLTQIVVPSDGIGGGSLIVALTGGGFGIAAISNNGVTGQALPRFLTFNAAGAQQGAALLGRSMVGSYPGNGLGRISPVALQNGGWAVFEAVNSGPILLYVFGANGVQSPGTITVNPGDSNNILGSAVQLANGVLLCAWVAGSVSQPPTNLAVYSINGPAPLVVGMGIGSYPNPPTIMVLGSKWLFHIGGQSNLVRWFDELTGVTPIQSDTVLFAPQAGGYKFYPVQYPSMPPGSTTFGASTFAANLVAVSIHYRYRPAYIPFGVATAIAAQGQPVTIQTTGVTRAARHFSQPLTLDARPVGGITMAITGTTVVMGRPVILRQSGFFGSIQGIGTLKTYTATSNATVDLVCTCGAGSGSVFFNGASIYRATTSYAPNQTIPIALTVGQTATISSDGSAAVSVFIREC